MHAVENNAESRECTAKSLRFSRLPNANREGSRGDTPERSTRQIALCSADKTEEVPRPGDIIFQLNDENFSLR